jgi:choline transport protein
MGKWGYPINAVAFISIIFFNVIFCLPYALPVETATMNYNSVILAGVAFLTTVWWFVHGSQKYPGPKMHAFEESQEGRRLSTV